MQVSRFSLLKYKILWVSYWTGILMPVRQSIPSTVLLTCHMYGVIKSGGRLFPPHFEEFVSFPPLSLCTCLSEGSEFLRLKCVWKCRITGRGLRYSRDVKTEEKVKILIYDRTATAHCSEWLLLYQITTEIRLKWWANRTKQKSISRQRYQWPVCQTQTRSGHGSP